MSKYDARPFRCGRQREEILLGVILVVDSFELANVQVADSLQPLQLRLDLGLLLQKTTKTRRRALARDGSVPLGCHASEALPS